MKKVLSFFLVIVMIVSLVACSTEPLVAETLNLPTMESEEKDKPVEEKPAESLDDVFERKGFSVGYARVDITPKGTVILGGFPNADQRKSKDVADNIYLTCVAISDGTKTALFFSYDMLNVPVYLRNQVATMMEKDLGITKELVWITATHSHHAPAVGFSGNDSIVRYLSQLYPAFRQCAKRAVETLDSAEMYIGTTETVNLNYVRRYMYADGTPAGSVGEAHDMTPDQGYHETEADHEMQIIKFDRKNAKDVVMVNWQSHYTSGTLKNEQISASWVSTFRSKMEKDLGIDFAFYQGAAGNVTISTRIKGEISYSDNHKEAGNRLAQTAIDAMPSLQKANTGSIKGISKMETCTINKDTEGYDLEIARRISELYATDQVAAMQLVAQYGFATYFHAHYLYQRSQYTTDTQDMEICAIRIGDVAFASAPYEMFHENGSQVKDGSPFDMTFMCAYTNGSFGYIATYEAFPNRGYEVDTCRFVRGTGEQVVNSLLGMLQDLHDNP